MWQLFLDYCTQIKSAPLIKNDFAGKDAAEVYKKLERPLTLEGFYNYLDDQEIITDATDYFENKDGRYKTMSVSVQRMKRMNQAGSDRGRHGWHIQSIHYTEVERTC
jgi:hypothetical protein